MTKDRYLNMCEQLNQEPDPERMPPGIEDFPDIVIEAINTYNGLSDNVAAEIGFIGKDYTNLSFFLEVYGIEDTEFFLEILSWLDSRAVKKSSDQLKKEYDKLKRKSSGIK
jgi:hypothetical protein